MKKYYGSETEKAVKNFTQDTGIVDLNFIHDLTIVKKAAVISNYKLRKLDKLKYPSIIQAIDEILEGKLDDQFVTSRIQGGAGTSIHMNLNEVIAQRATEISGTDIHYLDDVNLSQSTNDILPTALRLYLLNMVEKYLNQEGDLEDVFTALSQKYSHVSKVGRTHLQDAVPITFGQVFGAYANLVSRDIKRISEIKKYLRKTNLGGTAIGTMINSSESYVSLVNKELSLLTGIRFQPSKDLVDLTQNTDVFLHLIKLLEISTLGISKICNDIRLMASGPNAGLAELSLPIVQKGSTIMPGKNNPVILEYYNQISMRVIGNSVALSNCLLGGQFELNVYFPLFLHGLSESLDYMISGISVLKKHLPDLKINEKNCREMVRKNLMPKIINKNNLSFEEKENLSNMV